MGSKQSELEKYWDNIDGPASKQVKVLVIGCGQRGQNYAAFALDFPSRLRVVGVAEPLSHRRKMMQNRLIQGFIKRSSILYFVFVPNQMLVISVSLLFCRQ